MRYFKHSKPETQNVLFIPENTYKHVQFLILIRQIIFIKVKKIIEEKYVANFGVINEPWTDWRRTGYPSQIVKVPNAAVASSPDVPRSLFFPQSEFDLNKANLPNQDQKLNMLVRVFWDK